MRMLKEEMTVMPKISLISLLKAGSQVLELLFITKDNDHIKIDYGFSKYLEVEEGGEKRFCTRKKYFLLKS